MKGPAILFYILTLSKYSISFLVGSRRFSDLALFDFKNERERDEQWRIQQEILAKRKNPKSKEEGIKRIEERRRSVNAEVMKTMWAQTVKDPSVDPLGAWKQAKARGDVKDLGYEPTPPKESSLFGFSIPIIQSPIDVPKYDNGQRFDLRLPYAERGYEDADSDVMGKLGRAFGRLFGKGKEEGNANKSKEGDRQTTEKRKNR